MKNMKYNSIASENMAAYELFLKAETVNDEMEDEGLKRERFIQFKRKHCNQLFQAMAFLELGDIKNSQGLHFEAIAYYDEAIKLFPDADTYYKHGDSKFKLQRFEEAIEDFNKVIQLESDWAHAYNYRGECLINCNQKGKAILDFDKAIELAPDYFEAYCNRGITRAECGLLDEAQVDYKKAISLKPEDSERAKKLSHFKFTLDQLWAVRKSL